MSQNYGKDVGYEEGSVCRRDGCTGRIQIRESENCSCHISPPCSSCTSPRGYCPECDWQEADEPLETFNDWSVKPGTWIPVRVRPLDPTRLDYHSKSHTNASMIKEGVYPPSMTRAEVEAEVQGTFGGHFAHFGGGKFKYIAYTD